ncbi:Hypothetical protein D9617_27g044550 [Elsinoe fawcettii]|nr:Hypothetical protein D9617_27g044550 [Elsinoe fawcettii]
MLMLKGRAPSPSRFSIFRNRRNFGLLILGLILVTFFLPNHFDLGFDYTTSLDTVNRFTHHHADLDDFSNALEAQQDEEQESLQATGITEDDQCSTAPRARNVMINLKTGAAELQLKLPVHLLTLANCAPKDQFVIFSDREETFGGYPVHDALANVTSKWKKTHEDFATYRDIQRYRVGAQKLEKLVGSKGWKLDKWKFMPLVFRTFEMAPAHIEWFFFMEADTAVSWVNLLSYLDKLDPSKPHFIGNALAPNLAPFPKHPLLFAHGGSGYLLSRPALEILVEKREAEGAEKYDKRWEEYMLETCCGDVALAEALMEVDILITDASAVLHWNTPHGVVFGKDMWCRSPITQHHVDAFQINDMWRFQKAWVERYGWGTPYTWSDIYKVVVRDAIRQPRRDWFNWRDDQKYFSQAQAEKAGVTLDKYDDVEKASVESAENCAKVCDHVGADCLQWRWAPGRCFLGSQLMFGVAAEVGTELWTSGWHTERVTQVTESWGSC